VKVHEKLHDSCRWNKSGWNKSDLRKAITIFKQWRESIYLVPKLKYVLNVKKKKWFPDQRIWNYKRMKCPIGRIWGKDEYKSSPYSCATSMVYCRFTQKLQYCPYSHEGSQTPCEWTVVMMDQAVCHPWEVWCTGYLLVLGRDFVDRFKSFSQDLSHWCQVKPQHN